MNALPLVEIAYAEPVPEPAVVDMETVERGRRERGLAPVSDESTPNYQGSQGYIQPAPLGVDAPAAWTYAGGRGEGVKIIDIELGWNWNHEDHKAPFYQGGTATYDDHGVAVVGEIIGQDNGFGITGIANGVEIGCHSVYNIPTADAFNIVAAALDPGDIFVIELHCPGPLAAYIALEYWQANFDAIAAATAAGVICCEAAGNGSADFDSPVYDGLFDRDVRDSGAIIVGAAVGATLQPEWFTNYGSRVDLHGWGSNVVTTGYGDLQGGGQNQLYTAGFSGTSSATPIVTGAAACLQGAYKAVSGGVPLTPGTIAQILKETGTPQAGANHIGPRPDLAAAIPFMLNDLETIEGIVTRAVSGESLEDAEVRVLQTGARTATAADGSYSLVVTPGTWSVQASLFGHRTQVHSVTAPEGGVAVIDDFELVELPTASLTGVVIQNNGQPVSGAGVEIPGTPLPGAVTNALGEYEIPGVPRGFSGLVQASAPGFAPDVREFSFLGLIAQVDLRLGDPEDFEASGGGFTNISGQWQWGTPNFANGPSAHSGSKCWGTNLNGNYNSQDHILYSGSYDLDGLEDPRLSLWQWWSIWGPYDGGNVAISTNGGNSWTPLEPVGGYPDACIYAFNGCQPGYAGSAGGWVPGVFDLSGYAGQTVRFRVWLASYGFTFAPGYYVDDVAVHGAPAGASVDGETAAAEGRTALGRPVPNPARSGSALALRLPAAARVSLQIFDPAGRRIRSIDHGTLEAGAHLLPWDGRDSAGNAAAPGIYFMRVTSEGLADGFRSVGSEKVIVLR